MVILIYAENQCEEARGCIEQLRENIGNNEVDVVLIDNYSDDGLREWAKEQTDFTYVYLDEGKENYGKAINMVVDGLGIEDDLVVVPAGTSFCEGTVDRINDFIHLNPDKLLWALENIDALHSPTHRPRRRTISMSASHFGYCIRYDYYRMHSIPEEYNLSAAALIDMSLEAAADGISVYEMEIPLWCSNKPNNALMTIEDLKKLENKWNTHYYNVSPNKYLVKMVADLHLDSPNVLEIGCDLGATLLEIKNHIPNANIYGTDLNPASVKLASYFLDDVRINNIEEYDLDFDGIKFDAIIFGDVLEHLRNPEGALEFCKSILNPGGVIVASIPNVMHISVVESLLEGNFTYQEVGLLDKTHIHMFTFNEIVRMFSDRLHYDITYMDYTLGEITAKQNDLIDTLVQLSDSAQRFMYEAFQYLVVAKYQR